MEKGVSENGNGGKNGGPKCNHGNGLSDLKSSWKQFDNVGSKLLVQLCGSLAGSQYDIVTKEIVALLGPMFACGESELVLGRLKEIESLMTGNPEKGEIRNSGDNSEDNLQMTLRCLLLFMKLQAEYHQLCSDLVSSAIDHLTITCEDQENSELLQQIQSLKLKNMSAPLPSPVRHAALTRKMSGSGSSSPKHHKHGLKASLFSLFERKNSPEEGKSSFYVDIDQKKSEEDTVCSSQSENISDGHVTQNSQSDVLVDLGLDPSPSDKMLKEGISPTVGNSVLAPNGQVATQEELDSVINLLSGAGLGRGTMQTIPETRNPVNLQVPQAQPGAALSPSTSDSLDERMAPVRNKSQRRSEGSIDFSGFINTGHNTWPHQHRASLPGGQLGAPPQITYDFASTPVQQQQQNYCPGYRPTTLPPGGAGHFQTAYGMGFPDPKLNRTWPVNNLAGSGSVMDTINSSWSGGQDSDDLSDDSSCGEQFHTMSRLQYTEPRRDLFEDADGHYVKDDRTGEVKHHSLEDLLDGRSNTWPQQLQQPWSQSHLGAELMGPHDQTAYHRPISMQMSDPLSRRNIWQNTGQEFPLQPSQSQSVHGGLGPM
ncbi:uncharacterized protein LOC123549256 [Mercenaria mercenaria]|uniref:uncharacterized protein LOC123549256 n=1 Tax=Mercenaria mercenaria TaxID=6596 RepID=UPI00234E46E1|nr:uncharacterized protein LOC123549256 [Mercenaria mercenaria]